MKKAKRNRRSVYYSALDPEHPEVTFLRMEGDWTTLSREVYMPGDFSLQRLTRLFDDAAASNRKSKPRLEIHVPVYPTIRMTVKGKWRV